MLTAITKLIPITYAIIGFGMLIIIHEFGHFLFCKLFRIHTPTFSVGIGPKLIERKIGDTHFRLSALPLGGYVEISGLEESGQGKQKHAQDTGEGAMRSKPYWQRFLVLMGGIGFNIAFAYIALILMFMIGAPKPIINIKSILDNSAAKQAGLMAGDTIIKIGHYNIEERPSRLNNAVQYIQNSIGQAIDIKVSRNGKTKNFSVVIQSEPLTDKEFHDLDPKTNPPKKVTGRLGVEFGYEMSKVKERLPFMEAIKRGITTTNAYIAQTAQAFKLMFFKRSFQGAGGPVMILSESVKIAQHGLIYLLGFLAIISINLGLINLIPLPIFDGGQLLLTTIESIIRREMPTSIKNIIFISSWIMILMLFIYLTFNDIKRILF